MRPARTGPPSPAYNSSKGGGWAGTGRALPRPDKMQRRAAAVPGDAGAQGSKVRRALRGDTMKQLFTKINLVEALVVLVAGTALIICSITCQQDGMLALGGGLVGYLGGVVPPKVE